MPDPVVLPDFLEPDETQSLGDLPIGQQLDRLAAIRRGEVTATGEPVQQLPDFLEPDEATFTQQQISTAAKGAVGAGTIAAGAGMGTAIGVAGGTAIAPGIGTFLGGITGLLIGGYSGWMAGEGLERHGLAIVDEEQVPDELKSSLYFGQALGGGLSVGAQVQQIAKTGARLGATTVGRAIDGILDMAQHSPWQYWAGEAGSTLSAASAEAAYETLFPNRPWWERTTAGVVMGALNPARVVIGHHQEAGRSLMNFIRPMRPEAQRTRAGQLLRDFLQRATDEEGGVDVTKLIRLLANEDEIQKMIPGFRGTAAQVTGLPRLAALEAELARHNEEFFHLSQEVGNETLRASANAIALLRLSGDPQLVQATAQLRLARYRAALDGLELKARQDAVRAAENVSRDLSKADRAAASRELAQEIYGKALTTARDIEKEMYSVAMEGADDIPFVPRAVRRISARLQGELPAGATLPKEITDWLNVISRSQEIVAAADAGEKVLGDGSKLTAAVIKEARRRLSVGELQRFRSEMLSFARGQHRSTNANSDKLERRFGQMAEAALDDMVRAGFATRTVALKSGQTARKGAGGRFVTNPTAFDEARQITKQISDTFDRSFVGEAMAPTPYGVRVPPEVWLKRAFASGDEAAALRFEELEEAARFLPPDAYQTPEIIAQSQLSGRVVMDMQQRMLRLVAGELVDEVTNAAGETRYQVKSLAALRKFLNDKSEILKKFDVVRQDLEVAAQSEQNYLRWAARMKGEHRRLEQRPFAKLVGMESPADGVIGALNGETPIANLDELARVAQEAGEEGTLGLRAAIWDALMKPGGLATGPDGELSFTRLSDALFDPIRPGLPSLVDWMGQRGLIEVPERQLIDDLMALATNVMIRAENPAVGEVVVPEQHVLSRMINRAGGAMAGTRLLRAITPEGVQSTPTLLVAANAAETANRFLALLPDEAVRQILLDALKGEPLRPHVGIVRRIAARAGVAQLPAGGERFSLLKALLQPGSTPEEQLRTYYQLHAYAWQSALLTDDAEFVDYFNARQRGDEDALPAGFESVAPPDQDVRRLIPGLSLEQPAAEEADVRRLIPGLNPAPAPETQPAAEGDTLTPDPAVTPAGRLDISETMSPLREGTFRTEGAAPRVEPAPGEQIRVPSEPTQGAAPRVEPAPGEQIRVPAGLSQGAAPRVEPPSEGRGDAPAARSAEPTQGAAPRVEPAPRGSKPVIDTAPAGAAMRGERNNNPMNVEQVAGQRFKGETDKPQDQRFESFKTPEDGIRAGARVLLTYQRKYGLNTVRKIISRWAPGNENDTEAYINAVSARLGVRPNDIINLEDPIMLRALVRAVIHHENGRNIYSAQMVSDGVAAALGK